MDHTTSDHSDIIHSAKAALNNSVVSFRGEKDANLFGSFIWNDNNLMPSSSCNRSLVKKIQHTHTSFPYIAHGRNESVNDQNE